MEVVGRGRILRFSNFHIRERSFLNKSYCKLIASYGGSRRNISCRLRIRFSVSRTGFRFSGYCSRRIIPYGRLSTNNELGIVICLIRGTTNTFIERGNISRGLSLRGLGNLCRRSSIIVKRVLTSRGTSNLAVRRSFFLCVLTRG